ncbi:MAG TPA: EAL domain-containing protein [Novosphingobium sp.]|nr:EAL domain-containing protein [Novosphingobium sp.]
MTSPRDFARRLWRSRRFRILFSAVAAGLFCGVTMIGIPIEDLLIGTRTVLRRQPADQDIVVVKLDDNTLRDLDVDDVTRTDDGHLVDSLVVLGAKRIFFDRTYHFSQTPGEDRDFARTLAKYPGKVFLGARAAPDDDYEEISLFPSKAFTDRAGVVSLMGFNHPFKLSVSFPFRSKGPDGYVPSMSAKLADMETLPGGIFRPDYSIDASSIPQFDYVDALRRKIPADAVRGKDVIVAPTAITFSDFHEMPMQGYLPGALFQVIAAQTLKTGVPVKLGWTPALLLVTAIVGLGVTRRRVLTPWSIAGLVAIVGAAPVILDFYRVELELVPAMVVAGVAIFRSRSLEKVEKATSVNQASGLPSLQALRTSSAKVPGNLVALKIRNYGAILGNFAESVEAELAEEVARRIRISDAGAVIYHEGDVFLWTSALRDPVDTLDHLEGLHRIVQNGIRIEGREIDLSFNCGVDKDDQRLLATRIANVLQAAERAVRDDEIVHVHDTERDEAQFEISLLSALDRSIDNGEVWVAYQPKVDLKTNRIKGAEALVRWTHPERGFIPPDHFIRIAEEYHRIERLTQFVLNEAAKAAASIIAQGHDFAISVNISAQLLRNAGLPGMILGVLEAHRLPPERMILEITETDKFDRSEKTFQMMQELVGSGLQLSIDDFGTGNATIDYLRYMPAREVKIDKSFIQHMDTNPEDLSLVQSIIEMAHSINRRVVAEGVETEHVMGMLRDLQCDMIQGYYISKPVKLEEFVTLLPQPRMSEYG